MSLVLARTESMACGEWLHTWAHLYPGNTIAQTRAENIAGCKFFARAHEDVPVAEVTPMMAQAWAMKRPRDVKFLRLAWQKAVLAGIAPVNVWRVVETPRREKIPRVPPSAEQLEAILARCRARANPDWPEWRIYESRCYLWEHFADLVSFAAYTGARVGGCAELRLKDVDLLANRVTLHEKGGKTRTVALLGPSHEAIARACWRHPRRGRHGHVFLTSAGKPITRSWVCERWSKVRGDFPFGFHCLRHFAATWMLEQGASELDVAVQLGHVDSLGRPYPELVRRCYGHPDPNDALRRLEALGG